MSVYEPWDARIERVENGYIVYLSGDTPNEGSIAICEDGDNDDLKSIESALWEILEHFGKLGSKHDAERLVIRREKGE